jgi:hypothetical protein
VAATDSNTHGCTHRTRTTLQMAAGGSPFARNSPATSGVPTWNAATHKTLRCATYTAKTYRNRNKSISWRSAKCRAKCSHRWQRRDTASPSRPVLSHWDQTNKGCTLDNSRPNDNSAASLGLAPGRSAGSGALGVVFIHGWWQVRKCFKLLDATSRGQANKRGIWTCRGSSRTTPRKSVRIMACHTKCHDSNVTFLDAGHSWPPTKVRGAAISGHGASWRCHL